MEKVPWKLAYERKYQQRPEVKERRKQLRLEKSKKDKQKQNTKSYDGFQFTMVNSKNSQKVRKLDNGNYMTDDGIVLVPSMKALNETQTAVKVKVEKEEEVAHEDAKSYALFIDKQQSEIDRLKELCKKNKIDV